MIGKRKYIRQLHRKNPRLNTKQLASCTGKIRYITYQEAKQVADNKPSIVKTYKCNFCKYYHIGRGVKVY